MKLILFLAQYSKTLLFLSFITSLVSGFGSAGLIAMVQQSIINGVQNPVHWGFAFFGVLTTFVVLLVISTNLTAVLAENIVYKLRNELVGKILATPYQLIENKKSQIFAVLTEDINLISDRMKQLPNFMVGIGIISGSVIYLSTISWKLLIYLVILFFGAFFIVLAPSALLTKYGRKTRGVWDKLFEHFQALTEGIKELLLNDERKRHFMSEDLMPVLDVFRKANIKEKTLHGLLARAMDIFLFSSLGATVIFLHFYPVISFQQFSVFLTTIFFALKPVSYIINFLIFLPKLSVTIDQIENLGLSLYAQSPEALLPLPIQDKSAGLELKNIRFSYYNKSEDRQFELGPLSLTFLPGQITFIVGGNGSGKSTLGKLLCGLYPPQSGTLSLYKNTLNPDNQFQFHQFFSTVFADYYLFDSTLPGEGHSPDLGNRYLKDLQLSHKVQIDKAHRFSTTQLSQGQRKRLALLNTYLENRECYIFDEWAADQDPEFKKVFYEDIIQNLKKQGKIVVVITHDDQYFGCADQLIRLSEGVIQKETVEA